MQFVLKELGMRNFAGVLLVFCIAVVLSSPAQTFNNLLSFSGSDGSFPYFGSLTQGINGNLYGATYYGWGKTNPPYCSNGSGCGTIFKITPAGMLTTVYSFCSIESCTDGSNPSQSLVQATNGNFYGETAEGGAYGRGTIFEITPSGKLTTLYTFCSQALCPDGAYPFGGLVQAANGKFYGTTEDYGAHGGGTVFEMTAAGNLTTLYNFCAQTNCTDGSGPLSGILQGTDGNFYGTTVGGGAHNYGTVFQMTGTGKLKALYSFCAQTNCTDGDQPFGGLLQGGHGILYGTTYAGGSNNFGTVFEITTTGALTTLHSFDGADGGYPQVGVVAGSDGNGYGTTTLGGANGYGTIFEITKAGTFSTLYSFCAQAGCTDGENLYGNGLVQATNGNFYGTTYGGGTNGDGTVFSLSVGLGAFVEMLPGFGKVGNKIIILGSNLTGTSAVAFNGAAATFTVVSPTEITTTVPSGATTGTVSVTAPGGTLSSNVKFRVTPQITSFQPTSGPVGTVVTVTGVSLTQTTAVTFGGVNATSFTVNSDTQVTVTVPTGAKTGKIAITTSGGTAMSAASFTVT
jgi:uncharacterized repeat protein (TIGR03803 family)